MVNDNLKILVLLCVILLGFQKLSECYEQENFPPVCPSEIYCHGNLLHTIQMAKIYEDSKTFVDMKLKKPPNETLEIFQEWSRTHTNPSKLDVKKFVNSNFEPAGQEFEDWLPSDWTDKPEFLNAIADPKFRAWGETLNRIWKKLGRKMKTDVEINKDLYSIIWVPHPVIVPGGRFREFYYWDTYWIVQGLLLSEMYQTVKGILENFLYIVDTHGHIPNGGRIYYLQRSQPPLMIPAIKLYIDATGDTDFITKHIGTMEKEFDYWMNQHTKNITKDGRTYKLAVYGDKSQGPRPESYSEDFESANLISNNIAKKEDFYSELKAAAESGWDFSSRWFVTNSTNRGNLTNTKTRSIVPVDLNSIIFWNAQILSEFYADLNNISRSEYYKKIANEWLEGVEAILWHEEVGSWLDYDMINDIKRDYFYPSNIAPLWTGCFNRTTINQRIKLIMKYLQKKNIMSAGGIPTTMEHTGEQWDYPNAWPPLQHIMIVALNNTGDMNAVRLAFEIAEKWVRSNYKAFEDSNAMYEKYDATFLGGHGGGGEYEIQTGFGWSNGVIMDLLYKYSKQLTVDDPHPLNSSSNAEPVIKRTSSSITTALVAIVVSLVAGFIGVCIYKRRSKSQPLWQKKQDRPSTSNAQYTKLKYSSKTVRRQQGFSRGSKSP